MLAFVYSCFYFVLILWVLLALVWEFGYHPGPSIMPSNLGCYFGGWALKQVHRFWFMLANKDMECFKGLLEALAIVFEDENLMRLMEAFYLTRRSI